MNSLQAVNFFDSKNQCFDGLVPLAQPEEAQSPDERALLLQLAKFEHVHYVYFRRLAPHENEDTQVSRPAAYVVDNSDGTLNEDDIAQLHHNLWLHAAVPLVYVAWRTRVDVLSCARKPDFWDDSGSSPQLKYSPAEKINLSANISDELLKRRRLSAYRLADGTFWEEAENQKLTENSLAAHRSLIQAIVEQEFPQKFWLVSHYVALYRVNTS